MPIAPTQSGEVRDLPLALQSLGVGCLVGTVFDPNHKPVPDVGVHPLLLNDFLNAKALETPTDKHGRFQMHALNPGVYWVAVLAEHSDRSWRTDAGASEDAEPAHERGF